MSEDVATLVLRCRAGDRDAESALAHRHDLDDDQIAHAMHCRPATVRSLLSRARKRLSRHPALADHAARASIV